MQTININDRAWSRLVFGCASLSGQGGGYGFGDIKENDAIDLLNLAYSQGVNVYDTAPIYGYGQSEITLGKAFKSIRDKVTYISKCGVDWHDNKRVNMCNDPKIALKMFDESRTRLQSDYIDLYMVHWPDEKFDIRATLEPLLKLKSDGYIKQLGLCNTNLEDLSLATEIDFIQSEYNYFQNSFKGLPIDNYKTMGWGTFDKGILSGSVKKDRKFEKSDCRSWAPWFTKSNWKERVDIAKDLEEKIAPQSLKEFSIKHSLKGVDFVLVGMKNKDQLLSIIDLFDE